MNLKKEFKEIKAMFGDKKQIALSIDDSIRLKETLHTLRDRSFIRESFADNKCFCTLNSPIADIEKWVKEQDKSQKWLSLREWLIAIVSAIIGAVIGLIPTIVSLFTK